ncbi:hypothetical protein IQ250_00675 [Pseudanabaenaceae cyanobacterium LEGE 13415]|nr:hypothetical protein [Pseudanabaenaceae cyanobacterium LEGE 13415]
MLAIAEELVSRGHRVSFVINDAAKSWVTQTGAQFIPWNPPKGSEGLAKSSVRMWQAASQTVSRWKGDRIMLKQMISSYAPFWLKLP